MFNACMLILCVICIGIAVMPTDAYWLLMLLRCLQAAGSASTVALGTSWRMPLLSGWLIFPLNARRGRNR